MRIVSIKFQNLNSLKGIHAIRFDQQPFVGSNLFAITGPTGAGKTTILDAITLALYGRVHRYTKEAYESMTRHTSESYAEVEFETGDAVYRSKWAIKRSRGKSDGTMQQAKMELCEASTGQIIVGHPMSAVQQKIIETCGLDYNQFLRSVMLSQGDFTRFLKANENERSELLEKMTNTGIYSQISTFVYEQTKAKQVALQHQQARLDDVRMLTVDELDAYRDQLVEFCSREKTLMTEKIVCNQQWQWLEKIKTLQKKKQDLQAESGRLQLQYEENRPIFEQLHRYKKVSGFIPALAEIDTHLKNTNDIAQQVAQLTERIPVVQDAYDRISIQLASAGKEYDDALESMKVTEPKIIEAEKLDILIANKDRQAMRTGGLFQTATLAFGQLQKETRENEASAVTLADEVEHLKEWTAAHAHEAGLERTITMFVHQLQQQESILERMRKTEEEQKQYKLQEYNESAKLEVLAGKMEDSRQLMNDLVAQTAHLDVEMIESLAGKPLEDYVTEDKELPKLIGLCERQSELATKAAQTETLVLELHKRIQQVEEQIVQENDILSERTAVYNQAREYLTILQENVKLQLMIRNYEEDRKALKPGSPCPLCGSTHHPFEDGNYLNMTSDAEQKLRVQQQLVDSIFQQINNSHIGLQKMQSMLDNFRERQVVHEQEQLSIRDIFNNINLQLPAKLDIGNPAVIKAVIHKKKSRQAELTQLLNKIRLQDRQQQELKNQTGRLNEELVRMEGEMNESKLKVEHARMSFAKLQVDWSQWDAECLSITDRLNETLSSHQIQFSQNESQAVLSELHSRFDLFCDMQRQLQQKTVLLGEIRIGLQHAAKSLVEKSESLQQLNSECVAIQAELAQYREQRFAYLGNKDTQAERKRCAHAVQLSADLCEQFRKEVTERKQELEVARERLLQLQVDHCRMQEHGNLLTKSFIKRIQEDGIESINKVREYMMPGDKVNQIEKLYQESQQSQKALERSYRETDEELRAEEDKKLTEETQESLATKIETLEQLVAGVLQETGRVKQIIKTEEHNRLLYHQLSDEFELQKKEVTRWEKLSRLIGSADGKKFSRFAQGLTLEHLVHLANKHVGTFTDRYLIRKTPREDLVIEIVDKYQADIVRPVASLSGGESFLVSLALALGLSELASKRTQINSLFIDEGFGMLDAETLDVAISALENLQANGKTIGIISHVEVLKERIGTQIQVVKLQGGYSNIKVMAYGQVYQESL